jgi:hypothetical protein
MVVYSGTQWTTRYHLTKGRTMARFNLAESILSAIQAILPEARALANQCGERGSMSFEIIIGELVGLERLAEARVATSAYENHRRVLEACHVQADIPSARRG